MAEFKCSDKLRSMLMKLTNHSKKSKTNAVSSSGSSVREKSCSLLSALFSKMTYNNEKIFVNYEKVAINVEKSVFNQTIKYMKYMNETSSWENPKFGVEYRKIFRRVWANMTYTPNAEYTRKRLFAKEIKSTDIAGMTSYELMSPEMKASLKETNDFILCSCMTERPYDDSKPGLYTCGACKSNKTTFTQFQTRSADEPMTVFVRCMNCNKRWRC